MIDKWYVSKYLINCKENPSNTYVGETLQDIKAGGCWEWQSSEGPRKQSSCRKGQNLFRQSPFCPCDASKPLPASYVPWLSSVRRASLCHSSKQHLEGKEAAPHWPAVQQGLDPVLMTSPAADSFKRLAGTLPAVDENGNKIGGSFTHEVSLCTRMPYITFGRIKDRLALKGQRGVHKKHLYVNKSLKERLERNGRK